MQRNPRETAVCVWNCAHTRLTYRLSMTTENSQLKPHTHTCTPCTRTDETVDLYAVHWQLSSESHAHTSVMFNFSSSTNSPLHIWRVQLRKREFPNTNLQTLHNYLLALQDWAIAPPSRQLVVNQLIRHINARHSLSKLPASNFTEFSQTRKVSFGSVLFCRH